MTVIFVNVKFLKVFFLTCGQKGVIRCHTCNRFNTYLYSRILCWIITHIYWCQVGRLCPIWRMIKWYKLRRGFSPTVFNSLIHMEGGLELSVGVWHSVFKLWRYFRPKHAIFHTFIRSCDSLENFPRFQTIMVKKSWFSDQKGLKKPRVFGVTPTYITDIGEYPWEMCWSVVNFPRELNFFWGLSMKRWLLLSDFGT